MQYRSSLHQRCFWVLALLSILFTVPALATATPPTTPGSQQLIEFTQIIPSMDKLLESVFSVMKAMDLPGVVDTISRLVAGLLALLAFGIAYINYGFRKRIVLFGIDGSFNNMVLAGVTIIMIAVGFPRLMGEAGWALWRITYTSVETAIHPKMDEIIKDRTEKLANSVWDYSVHGLSSGWTPMSTAYATFQPNSDVPKDAMTGEAAAKDQYEKVKSAKESNGRYRMIWQIGSLLVAGMFMAYIGVVFGSGLFVAFSALLMPIAFAFMPLNSGIFTRSIGGIIASIFVAGTAPGLMLINIMIIFNGPLMYMKRMMDSQTQLAQASSQKTMNAVQACVGKAADDPGLINSITGAVQRAADNVNPMNNFFKEACVFSNAALNTFISMGQSLTYIIIGLIVVGMLFIGLSGLAMMTFREFKNVIDGIFVNGGGLGGSSGAGRKFASAVRNRMLGAGAVAVGMMTGNAALAGAGARSAASGSGALAGTAGAVVDQRIKSQLARKNAKNKKS